VNRSRRGDARSSLARGARRWCALAAAALSASLAASAPQPAAPASPFLGRWVFRAYGEEQGLLDASVECVLQDRVGFIWAGTDDGLFRFDGRRFQKFSREQGLPRTRVYQLYETPGGTLYVATGAGLARLSGQRFNVIGALGSAAISHQGVAADARGMLYVGTDRGLFVGREDRFAADAEASAAGEGPVGAVHVDRSGNLYFARGGRLFRKESGRVVEFGRVRGLPSDETIDEVQTDRAGRLFVRTVKRLFVLPRGATRFERDDAGLPDSSEFGRLAFDDRGELVVPTVKGLAFREGAVWRLVGRREGLPAETVLTAAVDREGSMWIGLLGAGIIQRLGGGEFRNLSSADGLSHDVVWSIGRQHAPDGVRGALWVGTELGVNRIDPVTGAIRVYLESDGLAGNVVNAVAAAPDGSMWIGSWPGGATRIFPDGRLRVYEAPDATREQFRVAAIHVGAEGDVWVGAVGGLYRMAPGADRLERVTVGRDQPDGVRGFAEDPSGILYAASKQGVLRLNGPSPRKFTRQDGLKEDWVSSIAFASDGSLVVAYRESIGAAKIILQGDRMTVRPIDTSTGLVSNKVVLVGRDASGAMWIGTGSGADVLDPAWAPAASYGKADGMISGDLDQNAFFAEPDGTVWLGSSRGLIRYQGGYVPPPPSPPSVVIVGVRAGDRPLAPGAPAMLGSGERDLSVSWRGLTFYEPTRVRYRQRMVGLVNQFTETDLTEARFPALPTGRFRFEVLCVSARGQVSREPAVFSIEVLPAWWESWWARVLYALAAAGLVAAFVRWRTRHLEAERRRLEEAVAARSAELAAANRELREASFTDALTGARNRRFFSTVIEDDVNRTLRVHSTPAANRPRNCDLIFYIVDIDHFKDVNDAYGHDRGDGVLAEVARRLTTVVRDSDRLIRWGGEEFLLISRDADRTRGDVLAARVMNAVGSQPFDIGGGQQVRQTCSVGWAPFPWYPDSTRTFAFTEVLKLADRAMYVSKQSGRNRSVGALPAGPYAEIGSRGGDWWERSLDESESTAVKLVRTGGPVLVEVTGNRK
jgi:diguanylate cyclase (GGDEF)-like protein